MRGKRKMKWNNTRQHDGTEMKWTRLFCSRFFSLSFIYLFRMNCACNDDNDKRKIKRKKRCFSQANCGIVVDICVPKKLCRWIEQNTASNATSSHTFYVLRIRVCNVCVSLLCCCYSSVSISLVQALLQSNCNNRLSVHHFDCRNFASAFFFCFVW